MSRSVDGTIFFVVHVIFTYSVLPVVLATDRNNSRVFYQCEVLQAEQYTLELMYLENEQYVIE
jgi:hypothetical protein